MALPFAAVAAKGVVFLVLRNRWKSMRVLKLRAVSEKTGLKSSAIYNRIAQGAFPRQVRLGPKSVGWIESEVDSWIAALIRERDETPSNGRARK